MGWGGKSCRWQGRYAMANGRARWSFRLCPSTTAESTTTPIHDDDFASCSTTVAAWRVSTTKQACDRNRPCVFFVGSEISSQCLSLVCVSKRVYVCVCICVFV